MSAALAFAALVAVLAAAVARWERLPDWAVAAGAAALLVLVGSISAAGARDALEDLGPTVGFAAALLVLADGCRRPGLFAYFGAAPRARGDRRVRGRRPARARARRRAASRPRSLSPPTRFVVDHATCAVLLV